MKIDKAELQKALEKVKPGLANKELIEQSTSFAFINNRVVTYNDEISISHPVPGLGDVTGAIKAQALYEFLNKVKRDTIVLEWEENQVIIKAGRSKAGLILEQEIKLPIEEIGDVDKWSKLPDGIIDAIKLCYPCCSRDMSRPVLTCVHVNGAVVEASDSFQIIQHRLDRAVPGKSFLIPATSVKELIRYDIKEMAQSDTWIHFRTPEGTVFSSRVVEGTFPDVNKIIEITDGQEFNFPDGMQEALGRANVFAKRSAAPGETPIVTIEILDGHITLSASNEYGWFEERLKTTSNNNFKFQIGIEFLISLLEKLKVCTISRDKIDKIGFRGENWQHVVAIMPRDDE